MSSRLQAGGRDRRDRERGSDRDREPRDRDRHTSSRQPPQSMQSGYSQDVEMAPPPPPSNNPGRVNEYFVPRDGIDREVITADICRYLGNDALVRPGTYEQSDGRPIQGYYINAYRNLTSAMIQDLKADSARWEQERRSQARITPGMGPGAQSMSSSGYRHSETHHQRQQYGPSALESSSYGPNSMQVDVDYPPPAKYPGTGAPGYGGASSASAYQSQPQQAQPYGQQQQARFAPPAPTGFGAQSQYADEPSLSYQDQQGFSQQGYGARPAGPSQTFGSNHPTAVSQPGVSYVGGSNMPVSVGLTSASGPYADSDYRSQRPAQGMQPTTAALGYGQTTLRQQPSAGVYSSLAGDPDQFPYATSRLDPFNGRGPGSGAYPAPTAIDAQDSSDLSAIQPAGLTQSTNYGAMQQDHDDYDANPRASVISSGQTSTSATLVGSSTPGQSSTSRRDGGGRDREHDRERERERERDRDRRERTGEDREDRHARERGERRHRRQ